MAATLDEARAQAEAKQSAARRTGQLFTDSGPLFGSKGATREAKENEILDTIPGLRGQLAGGPAVKLGSAKEDKRRAERAELTEEIKTLEGAVEKNEEILRYCAGQIRGVHRRRTRRTPPSSRPRRPSSRSCCEEAQPREGGASGFGYRSA